MQHTRSEHLQLSADGLVGGGHFLQGLRFYPYLRETPLDSGGDSVCFAYACMHMCMSVRSWVCTCNCMLVRARALCACKSCALLFGWHVLRVLLYFFVWHIYSFVFAKREKSRVQLRGTIIWNEVTKQVVCFAGADVTKLAGTDDVTKLDRQVLYFGYKPYFTRILQNTNRILHVHVKYKPCMFLCVCVCVCACVVSCIYMTW